MEIFRSKWSTSRGGPLWPVHLKLAVPFLNVLVSIGLLCLTVINISVKTQMDRVDSIGNFVRSNTVAFFFSRIIPLLSDCLVWQNGKHPTQLTQSNESTHYWHYLRVVAWPGFVSIDTPFRERWTQVLQEKWDVIFCTSGAARVSPLITLSSTWWIKIRLHFNWTSRRGRFFSSEIEQWDSLGLQETHHLKKST